MFTIKRAKLAEDREADSVTSADDSQFSDFSEGGDTDQENSRNTDDEIADGQRMKSRKTLKRKRRATEPSYFGATLESLLDTNAPSGLPLSLKPSVAHRKNDAKLELEARRAIQVERKEKEEKGRIRDVIGGWGGEGERSLRKVAQRGVVKLFNTIQQSQLAAAAAEQEAKTSRGTGKPSLPTPSLGRDKIKKKTHKVNRPRVERQSTSNSLAYRLMIDPLKFHACKRWSYLWFVFSSLPNASRALRHGLQPPKTVIRKDEWDRRLHEVPVTKHDLNRLIMDYLVIEGYKSAAQEFSDEAGITPPVDFESIESRMVIREALQRGDVEEAITRVNDLNPEILDTNPSLYFHLQQQKLIEYIRHGRIAEALQFAQDELAPRGEESPEFLAELERTMALLAFDSSSTAPSAITDLLSPAQRMKTAGEVNAAILDSFSQGKEVKLVQLLKLKCWGEKMLGERVEFPKVEVHEGISTGDNGVEADGMHE
ncbi:hypothetical protein JVU11DRAFT_5082 [Chiua virens]|nr:hypothetical protein JVU11DRAFT_5082 [Chiua virens]